MEGAEDVKKLLLGALVSGQELNVVENQCVDLAKSVSELPHPLAQNRAYQFIYKGLGRHEQHVVRTGARAPQQMSNGSRQMSLAQAGTTIDEERVIFLARPLGDCQRRGVGKLVARPDDEFRQRELGI